MCIIKLATAQKVPACMEFLNATIYKGMKVAVRTFIYPGWYFCFAYAAQPVYSTGLGAWELLSNPMRMFRWVIFLQHSPELVV